MKGLQIGSFSQQTQFYERKISKQIFVYSQKIDSQKWFIMRKNYQNNFRTNSFDMEAARSLFIARCINELNRNQHSENRLNESGKMTQERIISGNDLISFWVLLSI